MTDDDGIVVAGGYTGAELLPVGGFKILLVGHQQFGAGIEMQKLLRPLEGQVIGHYKERFLAQAQPFGLHSRGCHFKGLAGTDLVGQQGVAAVEHMGNGVLLVFPQANFRVHAHEMNVAAVVFTGPGGVEQLVVLFDQAFTALRVLPNPTRKSVLEGLLLLLGQSSFFFVQHPLLLAVHILNGIIHPHIFQIQGVLQNLVTIGPAGAVGLVGGHIIITGLGLALDLPFSCEG